MCSKPTFSSKVPQKGKACSRLLEPLNVAPNEKRCTIWPNNTSKTNETRIRPVLQFFAVINSLLTRLNLQSHLRSPLTGSLIIHTIICRAADSDFGKKTASW